MKSLLILITLFLVGCQELDQMDKLKETPYKFSIGQSVKIKGLDGKFTVEETQTVYRAIESGGPYKKYTLCYRNNLGEVVSEYFDENLLEINKCE